MATRTRKNALYLKQETAYGSEDTSSTSDGSGFAAVKCLSLDLLTDQKQMIETSFATGRNRKTAAETGPDGAQITCTIPLQGLVTHAGDGTAASSVSNDWLDLLMINFLGAANTTTGDGLTASATASSLATDAGTFSAQDVAAVQGASFDAGKVNWRRLGGSDPYTLDRNLNATPDGTEIAYGAKSYRGGIAAGATLSACYDLDGTVYLLLGGRVTSASLELPAGELAKVSFTIDFDSKADATATKTALPTIDAFAGTPIKGVLGSFAWGSTEYAAKSISVDFGVTAQPLSTVTTANGRSDIEVISVYPTVTIEPAFATTYEQDFRAGTERVLSVSMGGGVVSGGIMNSCNMHIEAARLSSVSVSDDGGRLRNSLAFECVDGGIFSGSVIAEYFQFSRA